MKYFSHFSSLPLYQLKNKKPTQPTTNRFVCEEELSTVDALHGCGGLTEYLGHNCYPFCMDGAEVCVFHETNYICLCSFLQAYYSAPLEVQVIFAHFKGYLAD